MTMTHVGSVLHVIYGDQRSITVIVRSSFATAIERHAMFRRPPLKRDLGNFARLLLTSGTVARSKLGVIGTEGVGRFIDQPFRSFPISIVDRNLVKVGSSAHSFPLDSGHEKGRPDGGPADTR